MKNLIFVTYDGIQNSVFSGQVIQPLLKKINNELNVKVYVVSFERNHLSKEIIAKYIPQNKNLNFIYYRRLPVLGKLSLYPSVYYLKRFLQQFDNYEIISRGPLAGWIAYKAINNMTNPFDSTRRALLPAFASGLRRAGRMNGESNCTKFTLQSRGLLAEEYKFAHLPQSNIFKHLWHTWRAKTLFDIEKEAYNLENIIIKPVSEALADYLIETYKAGPKKIVIELDDIPEMINPEQKNIWRTAVRTELGMQENTDVYCYNGAVKAWQCPDLIIEFFLQKYLEDNKSFLLVLTQDKEEFEKMLSSRKIPKENYYVISLQHEQIYKYLSACDYGLMFRKNNHIVNWVSRPVKAMEYKAAGLKIIHNNTVKWLIECQN